MYINKKGIRLVFILNFSQENDCYKIFHVAKLLEMFNMGNMEHRASFPNCRGNLTFDKKSEDQRGLVWRERKTCCTCLYVSKMHKVYTEVSSPNKETRSQDGYSKSGLE